MMQYGELSVVEKLLNIIGWVVGTSLSFIIGVSLVGKTLFLPYLNDLVSSVLGWCLLVFTVLGLILAIVNKSRDNL